MFERRFRALDLDLAVAADDDLAPSIEPLVATYPPARGEPTHRLFVGGPGPGAIELDGAAVRESAERRDVASHFELELYRLVHRASEGWVLHAAAVELAGRAWILAGPSGAGKSTLALGLVARGARYLSDEVVLVAPDLHVRGLARPLSFDSGAAPRVPGEAWREHATVASAPDGGVVRTVLLSPPATSIADGALPLGGFVRIAHGAAATYAPRPLSPGEALSLLWTCGFGGGRAALDVATRAVAAPSFALATRAVEEACAHVEALAGRSPHAGG